jgi:hypothetical protein
VCVGLASIHLRESAPLFVRFSPSGRPATLRMLELSLLRLQMIGVLATSTPIRFTRLARRLTDSVSLSLSLSLSLSM